MNKWSNLSSNMGIKDEDLPKNISIETNRVSLVINPNQYEKHNYYNMVNSCKHLMVTHILVLTILFKEYKDFFLVNSVKFLDPH